MTLQREVDVSPVVAVTLEGESPEATETNVLMRLAAAVPATPAP